MAVDKTLNIHWAGFPTDVNLMLCFDAPTNQQVVAQQNAIAWKVIEAGTSAGFAPVTYTAQLAFGQTELDANNVVQGSIYVKINQGQVVNLITDSTGRTQWDTPTAAVPPTKIISANNESKAKRIMSVGTVKGEDDYEPTFLWKDVGSTVTVEADFHPTLKAYVDLGYQENQFITADLTDKDFTEINLGPLDNNTDWDFSINDDGSYSLKQRTSVLGGPAAARPVVNIKYSLNLNWQATVGIAVASAALVAIAHACKSQSIEFVKTAPSGRSSRITVSKQGFSCDLLAKSIHAIIQAATKKSTVVNSDFYITDEACSNFNATEDGNLEIEHIAPASLAWYYAK